MKFNLLKSDCTQFYLKLIPEEPHKGLAVDVIVFTMVDGEMLDVSESVRKALLSSDFYYIGDVSKGFLHIPSVKYNPITNDWIEKLTKDLTCSLRRDVSIQLIKKYE